ncbi:polysaccharide export protein [Qipengyuania sp. XHP0211]|uniref:polysaccharide biosynthesis/export family protein n=1 Tax=Qipengyuania sp. XHP0211 TaxID=3038079 RepID=UPI00241D9B71|nr:polysaccharide biosynthesis/export family protein [Qipengyuania sp. XHP0211]MDG5750970.1 polysaccharide export protein [Qipengyuania sp. XHP0211]
MLRGLVLFLAFALSACFKPAADLPTGQAAYAVMPPAATSGLRDSYRIGVLDVLSVRVFQEPDLSFDEIQVDASGSINFPLIGQIQAVGKTPYQLSEELEAGLGENYLRSPQVVVGVTESAAQRVTVEGNVNEPGVYEISGSSSLLESIARAKGLTRVAVVDQIVVLRTINNQPMGAVFDLQAIREGKAPDPEILGGDKIVVGFSALKGTYRDLLQAAPLFNIFRTL